MLGAVYIVSALTAATVAALLLRAYARTRFRLLLWSAFCFVGFTVNGVLLFVDEFIVPQINLQSLRTGSALAGLLCLLYGLIWESR